MPLMVVTTACRTSFFLSIAQSMGFINKDLKKGLWMTLNGGVLQFSSPKFDLNEQTPEFEQVQIKTGG